MNNLEKYKIFYKITTHDGGDWTDIEMYISKDYINNLLWDDEVKLSYIIPSSKDTNLDRIYLYLDIDSQEWHYNGCYDNKFIIGKAQDNYILVVINDNINIHKHKSIGEIFNQMNTIIHERKGCHHFSDHNELQHIMFNIYYYYFDNTIINTNDINEHKFLIYLNYPYEIDVLKYKFIYRLSEYKYGFDFYGDPSLDMCIFKI